MVTACNSMINDHGRPVELRLEGLFRHFDPRASGIVDFEGMAVTAPTMAA